MLGKIERFKRSVCFAVVALGWSFGAKMAFAQSVPLLVQAEQMTLVAPMTLGNDNAAIGGQFISPSSGASSFSPVRNASVQVNVPAAGTYYLWARIEGLTDASDALYVGIDSSFDRIFPSATGSYEWVRVETSDASGIFGFALAAGAHTIQVGYGEIGARLDAVYLTGNAAEVPAFGPQRFLVQAESFNRVAPMTVGSETAAMGGQYLSPTSGTSSFSPVRSADAPVNVELGGTYYLWARIAGATADSDALYVGIDTSFDRIFPSAQGPYEWVRVETGDASGLFGFALAPGNHTFQVGYGEINAKLDAIYLTDDANEVPGFGPPSRIIEAESLTLQAPMTVGSDAAALSGQYVSPAAGTDSFAPVREASTTVNIPTAATYFLWARIEGPTAASDALYVGIDASFDRIFPSTTGTYEWVRVETADASGAFGFALTAGNHTIQVGHGEIGARLDALYLTDSASDVPTAAPSTPPPPVACANPSGGYEGFGRNTTGGAGQPVYHVTRLDDSVPGAPGTLRDALSQGNRCVVFDVGGTISLADYLFVTGGNVTIDGFTAPAPGITLQNATPTTPGTLVMEGPRTGSNIVIRGIRHRRSPDDGMRVFGGISQGANPPVSNVVFDHVSVTGAGDGAIDVTDGAQNVTIQWSIIGPGTFTEVTLISFGAQRISVHHNLYVEAKARQPACNAAATTEVVCDVRNNLIWNYHQAGTEVRFSGLGNVINNYYKAGSGAIPEQTIWIDTSGVAFTSGNFSQDGFNVSNGNRSTPFPVDPAFIPAVTDARTAAQAVRAQAGARGPNFGLDATDQAFVNGVAIP
jgi:hypothetical protein